ncbi:MULTISPECIES: class I SAM-dependent methyltransferase [unclassified Coleofasciculus]|uniref:class I SAM-dependent methyltransferase n=1 Tax=unclassified Coleofasciculus TaxID=2692782 RepID=UPI0018807BBB|nr:MULTISPECIES: methyltransferase domain-containing protein [unclassified Coleofasciculus]MBE9125812.1 methyltransferase domain-containing protein [Coleofasciculus sp. LEGE 07081]MBE9149003.1 methyltransferase domain-containing protein [Coleofasciculus sp. LEGE 07092]
MTGYSYHGSELALFKEARNWKAYYRQFIKNYLGTEVLEVGSGIGSTTELLCQGSHKRWVCLEPDPILAGQLKQSIETGRLPEYCELKPGTLLNISHYERFNTVIYIDVLEHIKDDHAEVKLALNYLKDGGFLVILAPAHQWLFTPFDEAIGHYRRYSRNRLSALVPKNLKCISIRYLDSGGLIASTGNRFLLKSRMPNKNHIVLWDKAMIPLSKVLDPLFHYLMGKSLLGIWQKKV